MALMRPTICQKNARLTGAVYESGGSRVGHHCRGGLVTKLNFGGEGERIPYDIIRVFNKLYALLTSDIFWPQFLQF